jgi:anti-sigma regulatory factor (Ser/Thr protein kinase)
VLGDVCGQGVPAAALTSLVRYTVRAAARMWQSPAEVLRFTNDAILDAETGERFCTLLVAIVRPGADGATVTLAAGGHHLPLHRPVDGAPAPVGRVGTAMGLIRHPDVSDTTVRLGVGDVLVFTTDGVIEARDEAGALVGEGFLEHLVDRHAAEGAEVLAGAIERAVLAVGGGRSQDDVAVLVVEVTGLGASVEAPEATRPGVAGGPFDERFPAETPSVTEARRAVAAWLDGQGIRGSRVPDLLLALTELATNAVRSARTAMEVRAWLTPDAIMFEVTDDGAGFDPTVPRSAREIDPLAERGRGLFIVAALVDECTIESGPNGTIVRCYLAR